tara:strand:- start:2098 stop:2529 length:432 start_codon:yes stop_codon:yes gene_type:complete
MGFEEEVEKADAEIKRGLDKARSGLIAEHYKPLFEKVKNEVMKYFNESGESCLKLQPTSLEFREDGHFHNPSKPNMCSGASGRSIDDLDYDYSDVMPRDMSLEDRHDYHVIMKYALNDFRQRAIEAISKPLLTSQESLTAPLA